MDWGHVRNLPARWRSVGVDVLAWGNQVLDRVEAWGPVAHWLRDRPVFEDPYECGGYLGKLDEIVGGLPHYNYAGEEISFREAMVAASDPNHYHVGNDYVRTGKGLMRVSTIFPGVEVGPSWYGGPPVLFETMVESEHHGWIYQQRWRTLEQAVAGHRAVRDMLAQTWWTNLGGLA